MDVEKTAMIQRSVAIQSLEDRVAGHCSPTNRK